MKQSDIIKAGYEKIYENLTKLSENEKIFQLSNEGLIRPKTDAHSVICAGISDICQLCSDKNGEKIEENETLFETPARIGCMLSLTVISKFYNQLLETTGLLIQYFKDNNEIILDNYKWHGEDEGKIFIEPVIRKLEPQHISNLNENPFITLEFQMEFGINSLKGTPFKRVEKKDIKGSIM